MNVTADELRPLPNVEYAPAWNAGWCAPSMPPRVPRASAAEGGACARIVDDEPDRAYGWRAEHPRVDGWALGNRDAQREYRVYAPPGRRRRPRADERGVVDVGLRGALATKNADAGDPVYLPAPATITALGWRARRQRRRRRPARSRRPPRVPGGLHRPAHRLRAGDGFAGLAVREQDGRGVVDLKIVRA